MPSIGERIVVLFKFASVISIVALDCSRAAEAAKYFDLESSSSSLEISLFS
jgi:hypothetical protein